MTQTHSTSPQPHRHRWTLLTIVALAAFALVGCGGSDNETTAVVDDTDSTTTQPPSQTADADTSESFPLTISHAFGETVIDTEPTRVVAWGWASADAAIAVDVVPVAIPYQAYGGDADGVLPWIREAVEDSGTELPSVLPDIPAGDSPPFEAIAAQQPDLILAVYSGITEDDYALLSAIAPTIAYPDQPWATEWHDVIRIVGESLGRPDAAAQVLADIDDSIAAAAEQHPEFSGLTVAQTWDTGDVFYVYEPADARVGFTTDLGFEVAPAVTALGTDESSFYFTLSHERLDELDSDLIIAYADTDDAMQSFLDSAAGQLMEQVREGRVAQVVGPEFVASVSPPTALSLTWGLDHYVQILADTIASTGDSKESTDTAEDEAAAAWSTVFDSEAPLEDKAPHLETAETLAETIEAYRMAGDAMGGISLVPSVVVIDGDTATVTYDVLFGANAAYTDLTGDINLIDGVWVVGRDEFCGFMASARTPCA